jgi:flagellar protein FliO/FliZ
MLVILGVLAGSSVGLAGDGQIMQGDSPNMFVMMLKVIVYLILIIGLFFLIMKIVAQKNRKRMQGRAINPLGGVPLGQNKSLQIVEIGRSVYLLGVGDNVQLIQKIDDPEEVAYLIATINAESESPYAGVKQVSKWFARLRQQGSQSEDQHEDKIAHTFQEVFQGKMSSMASRKQTIEQLLKNQKYTDRSSDE